MRATDSKSPGDEIGKSRLDNVDFEPRQLPRDADFLVTDRLDAQGLLAVASVVSNI